MIRPTMRWRDRRKLFKNVMLPETFMTGKLFAIGSCFAENVVKVLQSRNVNAQLSAAGLFYTPTTIADYLHLLAQDAPRAKIIENNNRSYSPHMESKWEGSKNELEQKFSSQIEQDREWLKNADNIVITLGLNEQVVLIENDEISQCRQMPPLAILKNIDKKIEVQVLKVVDIKVALGRIKTAIKLLNPKANILFTVSPVPLHATYQNLDIIISNSRSKYSLHSALHEFLEENQNIFYFPSFEHAQDLQSEGGFWENDERHISEKGVSILMTYLAAYAGKETYLENEVKNISTYDLKRTIKKKIKTTLKGLKFDR